MKVTKKLSLLKYLLDNLNAYNFCSDKLKLEDLEILSGEGLNSLCRGRGITCQGRKGDWQL